MKKILMISSLAIALVTAVFANGKAAAPAAENDGTIRWAYWGSGERVEISQKAIDLYESRNPGVKINPEVSGGAGDHFVKVDTQLAGGMGPDIIQMGGNIYDYSDVILSLNAYAGTLLDVDAIDDSAIESGTINGELKGVSTGVTMPALVYNKTMIEKAGVPLPSFTMTYAEFRNYLVLLKSKLPAGTYPMQDIGVTSSSSTAFGYWTRFNGTPLYDGDTNSTAVTAAAAQKYLDLFKDYRDNGLVPPPDVAAGFAESNADTSALIAGKVAIAFLFTNQLSGYQAATTDELNFLEFPGAAATKALWQAPSQFYTVNKDSKNIEETVKFINFLVNDPEAAKILGSNRGASASSSARAAGAGSATDQKVFDYLEKSKDHASMETDHVPNDTEFNSTLFLIYQRVAFGQIDTKEGGKQVADLIQRMISK